MHQDEQYMQKALQLAELGRGEVNPNPMVGCVIIKDGRMIGKGWHQKYGEAHAEKNAIDSISDKTLLKGSTVYVNLEPCSHYGKTPPCSNLLVAHEVGRVVISNQDPNPLVNGGGIKKLKDAGIEVVTGVLYKEGKALNEDFFRQVNPKRIEAFD